MIHQQEHMGGIGALHHYVDHNRNINAEIHEISWLKREWHEGEGLTLLGHSDLLLLPCTPAHITSLTKILYGNYSSLCSDEEFQALLTRRHENIRDTITCSCYKYMTEIFSQIAICCNLKDILVCKLSMTFQIKNIHHCITHEPHYHRILQLFYLIKSSFDENPGWNFIVEILVMKDLNLVYENG